MDDWIGAWATLVVGLFGLVQWLISERARTRRRDGEMVQWGSEVIELMSDLEIRCEFPEEPRDINALRLTAAKASALVDRGRLFFPNISETSEPDIEGSASSRRGLRPAVLDEVVRCYLLAKHLIDFSNPVEKDFKTLLRAARRRFVAKLQVEMGKTLRHATIDKAGISLPADPRRW